MQQEKKAAAAGESSVDDADKSRKAEAAAERKRQAELDAAARKQAREDAKAQRLAESKAAMATQQPHSIPKATKGDDIDHTTTSDQLRERIRQNNRRIESNDKIIENMQRRHSNDDERFVLTEISELRAKLTDARGLCHELRDTT
jgi:DNA-binding response OmpR family regulator